MPGLDTFVQGWTPNDVTEFDTLPHSRANALAAVLDGTERFAARDSLPALWHWVFFQSWPAQHELGGDGHPAQGWFAPPIPDRRRMFAGGRVQLLRALRLDVPTERRLSLGEVSVKNGRSGELVFVTVRGEFRQDGAVCSVEEQDLVYRSGPARTSPIAHDRPMTFPISADSWQRERTGDPMRLFRFSALTANAHRIHYDALYARDVEGYPDVVVHGPLLALWMHELARTHYPNPYPSTMHYRFHHPVFAGDPLLITGDANDRGGADLAVRTEQHRAVAEMSVSPAEREHAEAATDR